VKTISLKKVSAVAVASLGFGLLSVVPAQAVVANTSATTTVGTPVRTAAGVVTVPVSVAMVGTGYVVGSTAWTVALTGTTYSQSGSIDPKLEAGTVTSNATSTTAATLTFDVTVTATSDGSTGLNGTASTLLASVANLAGTYGLVVVATSTDAATAASAAFTISAATVTSGSLVAPTAGTGSTKAALVQQVNGQATVAFSSGTSDTSYSVTTAGVGTIVSASATTATVNLNGSNANGGVSWTPVTNAQTLSVVTSSTVAGTQTLTIQPIGASGIPGTAITATITWGTSPAPSAQYSLLTLNTTSGTTASGAAADTTVTTASSSVSSGAALRYTIQVVVKDQNDAALSGMTLGAKIDSTAGSLGIAEATTTAGAVAGSSLTKLMTNSIGAIGVYSNGVAGKAVITITATTAAGVSTTLGTKTVTFVGSASKATVTQNLFVVKAGAQLGVTPATTKVTEAGVSTIPALTAVVTDSAGVGVTSVPTVKIESSDSTVIVAGTCVALSVDADPATSGAQAVPGTFECPVSGAVGAASGKSATITFSVYSATTGLYSIVATPVTFTIGGAIAKSVITTDKASYTAGEAITLIATSTDSSGNAAYDGQTPYTSISSNKGFGGSLPATTKEIVSGKTSTTSSKGVASLFAPSTPGSFTITGLYTDAATGTAYSVAGSVVDGNAALVTQIDALNAKIVALNALIAKIMKKLGVK